jgi:hypothetical protein
MEKYVSQLRKPKIFLSHSSGDREFIQSLNADLNKCNIDTWFDVESIRPGQPWLSAIFKDGIPNCDMVFGYFTENTAGSTMVEKEIDSAMILLAEKGIRLLPYVCSDAVRKQLRVDLRALHCKVFNKNNYVEQFPLLVSEIWKCYIEKMVNETQVYSASNQRHIIRDFLRRSYISSDGTVSINSHIDIDDSGGAVIYREYDLLLKTPMSCHSYDVFLDKPGKIEIHKIRDLVEDIDLDHLEVEKSDTSLLCYILFNEIKRQRTRIKFSIEAKAENYMSDLTDKGVGRWAFKNRVNPKTKGFIQTFTFPNTDKFKNITATILLCGVRKIFNKKINPYEKDGRLIMDFDLSVEKGFSDDVLIEFKNL